MKKMTKKELRLVTGGLTATAAQPFCIGNPNFQCFYDSDGNLIGATPPICIKYC